MTWPAADLFADRGDRRLDKVRRRPVAARPADLKKICDQLRTQRRVMHLGMELHRPDAALLVGNPSQRVCRNGDAAKSGRQFLRLVAVAHPNLDRSRQIRKKRRRAVFDRHLGMAVLALGRRAHLAARVMHDEVQSVADAESGHIKLQHTRVGGRRVGIVHRRRAAGKNQSDGIAGLNLTERRRARQHNGEDILLADAPRNQLRVLRAKVEDYDCLGVHASVWQGADAM